VKGVSESMTAFEKLNETADSAMVEAWVEQDREAQLHRSTDPSAMDIFDVQLQKGESRPIYVRSAPSVIKCS
jgi:vacuolar-type H+-ATPase subunit I/STV1